MSHPDYDQITHDHAALLVLLKSIGTQMKQKTLTRLYDRIGRSGSKFTIVDSSGITRKIFVRFVKDYPIDNVEWGDFQTHRRLLGLITFGKYDDQVGLNELCRLHETLKVKYNATLYDSRAILFGHCETDNINEPPKGLNTPPNFKTIAAFFHDETCPNLEIQVTECLHSLFWILESKRLKKSREKIEKVTLLRVPFEKKELIGVDLESRNNKKRCSGRMIKHLADLCLQAGLYTDALNYYSIAAGNLQSVNDWLWLGASYEGLCATSALILYPNLRRNLPLQRNSSLQEGSPGKQRRESQCLIGQSSPLSVVDPWADISHILAPEEIAKKYREAIIHYSKYQNAGIIEIEACFKAARISIEQNYILQAATFLSNVVFNHIDISEQEKIERFTKLSELYQSFGFSRKAAFCMRLAATRHVSHSNPRPNWEQCYNLILQATSGFRLSLDPVDMVHNRKGWPAIQIQITNELIAAANRMGNPALATRHMTFLLQTLFNYLSESERQEIALQLQGVAQQCEGAPVPLVLESGVVIPPANLINIPKTKSFTLKSFKLHLQPQKIEQVKEDHGPFLFTPINFGSLERKNIHSSKSKVDYLWVEGDICEVSVELINPLNFELIVSDIRLLTSGVVFESIPVNITLPAECGPISITLTGTPKEAGELEILGFSTHTLGVKSNCRLRNIEGIPHTQYSVEVIPALPKIDISTSLPQTASFSCGENIVTSASTSLYGGESVECTISIRNVSPVAIEMIDVSLQSALDSEIQSKIFKWSDANIETQLPLQPDATASITLYLYGHMEFILPTKCVPAHSVILNQTNNSINHNGGSKYSLSQLQLKSQSHQSDLSKTSIMSINSSAPKVRLSELDTPLTTSNVIEGQLNIKYSGNVGLEAGYCRVSSVFITIEIIPSVKITNWDVLPAETPSQFYLVLDLTNMTHQEMELHYTESKWIYMGGMESCRIPVPVNRCPLNKLSPLNDIGVSSELQTVCAQHIISLVDLKWQLLSTDSRGKATLSGINFNQNMLDIVRMSPVQWEVLINNVTVKPQDEITCALGDCINIGVGVCNVLEEPLVDLYLSINFYQDYHNGVNNYRLDTRLSFASANKVSLPTLQGYGRVYHECHVVFFTAGQYKLDIQCSSRKFISNFNTNSNFLQGGVWRYIPPIDIIVDDS